jgi:hypothetical protein
MVAAVQQSFFYFLALIDIVRTRKGNCALESGRGVCGFRLS